MNKKVKLEIERCIGMKRRIRKANANRLGMEFSVYQKAEKKLNKNMARGVDYVIGRLGKGV